MIFRHMAAGRLAFLILAAATAPVHAQDGQHFPPGTLTLQRDPNDPSVLLGRYLRELSSDPRDLGALTGAGRAALAMGDPNAAIGFFGRAEEVSPRNGRVKAGLAAALVQQEQPRDALKLFDQAIALGVPAAEIGGDRGLAYDLIGDPRRAQADYRAALARKKDDEVTRRLALSTAISGDRAGAIALLDPLMRKQDKAAWRASTFILAMTGDPAGATRRANQLMVPSQASAMTPYLLRLGGLDAGAKAAAVHFGRFPAAGATAGTMTAAVARPAPQPVRTAQASTPVAAAVPDRHSAPTGAAGGPSTRAVAQPAASAPTAVAAAKPTAATVNPASNPAPAPVQVAAVSLPPADAPIRLITTPASSAGSTTPPAAFAPPSQPKATVSPLVVNTPPKAKPKPPAAKVAVADAPKPAAKKPTKIAAAETKAATAKATTNLAKADDKPAKTGDGDGDETKTADAGKSAAAKGKTGKSKGKVELADASDAKAKAKSTAKARSSAKDEDEAEAKAGSGKGAKSDAKTKGKSAAKSKSKDPERYWVQVAGGANKAALPKAWGGLKKKYPALLKGRTAYTTPLRATNRLLVGPFKSADEAQAFVNKTGGAGLNSFSFASAAGQEVDKLAVE